MIERASTVSWHALSRRRLIMLGAGALAGLSPRPAEAVVKLDVTQGNVQPIPIAIPDFVGVATQDPDLGRNVSQIIAANLQRSGLFLPIDPAALHREDLQRRRGAALCGLEADQRPGAGHWPRHPG